MITIINRKFLPNKLKVNAWDVLAPYFNELLVREINDKSALEKWLSDRSELEAFVSEDLAWRYVKMTCDSNNKDLEQAYLFFVTEIEPQISPISDQLNKKLVACKFMEELDHDKYFIYLRGIKSEIEIFREENVPLMAEIATESQKYGSIVGGLSVTIDGKELTLQQAANFLKNTDRAKREDAFLKINEVRAAHAQELDDLFDKLIALRNKVALNAGFNNFRDYMSKHDCSCTIVVVV